jgi:hypothetical protein
MADKLKGSEKQDLCGTDGQPEGMEVKPLLADPAKRQAFSGPVKWIFIGLMLVFAFHGATHMVAAGDTWVAMACGRHFLNHGVDTVEPFSANSHEAGPTEDDIEEWPQPFKGIANLVGLKVVRAVHPTGWINQNWGTHILFYWLAKTFGEPEGYNYNYNMLVVWKFAVTFLCAAVIYYLARVLGANSALAAVMGAFAIFVGRSFIDIRPAVYSNLMVPLFLLSLALTIYKDVRFIWLVLPVTLFWANVHGGYIYIFIMLVPFIGIHLLGALPKKQSLILFNAGAWPVLFLVFLKANQTEVSPLNESPYSTFFVLLAGIVVLELVLIFAKDRLISLDLKSIIHVVIATGVTFLAVIVLNPFHLTNLTHTFEISLSKHAESWRLVREWRPGFEWENPVGLSFPFLTFYIFTIGSAVLWLFCLFLRPGKEKLIGELEQKRYCQRTRILFVVLGCLGALFFWYFVLVSGSAVDIYPASISIFLGFMAIILAAVLVNVHFIHLVILFVPAVLAITGENEAYLGRYIYPLITAPVYCVSYIVYCILTGQKAKWLNGVYAICSGLVALIVMNLIFNPFELDNRINIFRLWGMNRLWRPTSEGRVALNRDFYFAYYYVFNLLSVGAVFVFSYIKRHIVGVESSSKASENIENAESFKDSEGSQGNESYEWPKVELSLIIISAMTIYMAIRSRRFIPIAAAAAGPVIAMMLNQLFCMVKARWSFASEGRVKRPVMGARLQRSFCWVGLAVFLFFGSYWGLKFKRIYLDPWPDEAKYDSVFMRMTASHLKPHELGEFLRLNGLQGNMFNYWTEGGALAFQQEPDPETGRTPLQLFMDGRAQAAYDHSVFQLWRQIHSGGPIIHKAKMSGRNPSRGELQKAGRWIDAVFNRYDVWVVIMPNNELGADSIKAISLNPRWRVAYKDYNQIMFVDITTVKGRELIGGIRNGDTKYPSEYSTKLAVAHNALLIDDKSQIEMGIEIISELLKDYPSQSTVESALPGLFNPESRTKMYAVLDRFVKRFIENHNSLAEDRSGYLRHLNGVNLALINLVNITPRDSERHSYYKKHLNRFRQESAKIRERSVW